jgi:hypothetical protein
MRSTHTFAVLEISQAAWEEIARKLRATDYGHAFVEDKTIDMHGIALRAEAADARKPVICAKCEHFLFSEFGFNAGDIPRCAATRVSFVTNGPRNFGNCEVINKDGDCPKFVRKPEAVPTPSLWRKVRIALGFKGAA